MTDAGIVQHSTHLHQTTPAMAFNADADLGGPHQKEILEYCHAYGHRNYLITCDVNPKTQFSQWLSLYREDPMQICTEEETQILANVAPHLMQALAINRVIHLDRMAGDLARERWSVAIADTKGGIYHASKTFWDLLACE